MDLFYTLIIIRILTAVAAKMGFDFRKWDFKNKWKKLELNGEEEEETKILNLLEFPPEVQLLVASYFSSNKVNNFGLGNKRCHQIRQSVLNKKLTECVDLRKFFYLDEEKLLDRVRNITYKSVNLNQCYYLSPVFITELVSRESIRELDLTECNCTPEVIEVIAQLNLTSLTISLSNTWREFFVSKQNNSVPFLNGLKKLEVYHRFRSIFMMSQVSLYVLPHCHQLRHLKLFSPSSLLFYENGESQQVFQFPKFTPTPVPNLESLVLDFHNHDDITQHIKTFLELILYRKTVPLTNIYLGKQTVKALSLGILNHKLISFDNASTFCICRGTYSVFNSSDAKSVIASMRKCTKYKRISVERCCVLDCCYYIERFVNFDQTSVKEINLSRTKTINSGLCSLINKISNLCPGITFLDISIRDWSRTLADNPQLNNEDLMKCLAKLPNLRTLRMVPQMLRPSARKDEENFVILFREVTKKCGMLRNLQIASRVKPGRVSSDVLWCIKFFKNLRKLSLIYFCTGKEAVVPEIVRSCSKLKCLRLADLCCKVRLEEILPHAKHIKHLYVHLKYKLNKTLVDNLSECTQLEKLYLYLSADTNKKMLKYFAQSLKKLNKLQFLSTTDRDYLRSEYFHSANNEIKNKRPKFFFDNLDDARIPMVHHSFMVGPQ